jgi:hypothetical protein
VSVSLRDEEFECANCRRLFPAAELDQSRWCPDCRAIVVRRATIVGRLSGIIFATALGIWIFSVVGAGSRFLMAYVIMIAAAYFFLFKLTQRVAFEVIRSRGVPPPKTDA